MNIIFMATTTTTITTLNEANTMEVGRPNPTLRKINTNMSKIRLTIPKTVKNQTTTTPAQNQIIK
jgi:hypothetical protein